MINYSPKTLRTMFGKPILPKIPIALSEISLQAQKLAGKLSISGVQPKLSVRLDGQQLIPVDHDGQFILKPQTQEFIELPQNEYLCMQMGKSFGLKTADCILLELSDGSPAYLVKRFDRRKKGNKIQKLPCEDMQQILGGPSKYKGSHEQIARTIDKYCSFAPLEKQRLFEVTVFNFAIGNGDAHKKNLSLLTCDGNVAMSPMYDLVSSRLVLPEEADELALAICGKQNRLMAKDFLNFAEHIGIDTKYAQKIISKLRGLQNNFEEMIIASEMNALLQEKLIVILKDRLNRLQLKL